MEDNGTGTAIPGAGTGTAIPNNNTGTAVPDSGTGTAVPLDGTGIPGIPGNAATRRGHLGSTADIPDLPEYLINGIRYKLINPINKKSGEARVFVVENDGKNSL